MIGGAIKWLVIFALSTFALGWVASSAISEINLDSPFSGIAKERPSPFDWVKKQLQE